MVFQYVLEIIMLHPHVAEFESASEFLNILKKRDKTWGVIWVDTPREEIRLQNQFSSNQELLEYFIVSVQVKWNPIDGAHCKPRKPQV